MASNQAMSKDYYGFRRFGVERSESTQEQELMLVDDPLDWKVIERIETNWRDLMKLKDKPHARRSTGLSWQDQYPTSFLYESPPEIERLTKVIRDTVSQRKQLATIVQKELIRAYIDGINWAINHDRLCDWRLLIDRRCKLEEALKELEAK